MRRRSRRKISTVNDTTETMTDDQAIDLMIAPETEEVEAEAPVEEQTEADEEAVETEDVDEAEPADVDEDDGEDEPADQEEPETFAVTIDGEEVTVSLADLKQGYSGQKYIQKGMRENADARKALQQREADLNAHAEQLLQTVQQFQETGYIPAPTPPDPSMAQTDPLGYVEAQAEFQQLAGVYQQQQAQIEQARQMQARHQEQARGQYIQEQVETLKADIPEFADPQKAEALNAEIRRTAVEDYGFSIEDVNGIVDARMIRALHDLSQYRAIKKGTAKATEKAAKARPVVKAGKAHTPGTKTRNAERNLKKRLRESGSDDDAIALMMRPD